MESKNKNIVKTLSKINIQEKICELVYRAETFLKWSNKLLDLYIEERDRYKNYLKKLYRFDEKSITSCIIIHNVLYFQEAIIILNSLFESKSRPTEISFNYYFANNTEKNDLKKKIDEIRKEYRAAHLEMFRNKIIAHKQADIAGDPIVAFLNPIKGEHIENACSIVKNLRSFMSKFFNCSGNNYFESFYNPGFEFLYNFCEKNLRKKIK